MEKILVTGGAGYIGSHCAKILSQKSFIPVVLDNLSTGHKEFLKFGPYYIGDLLDEEILKKIFSEHKIAGVIHFAAKSLVAESVQYPELYYKNNIQGTENLLKVMSQYHVKRIIFSSSASIYGKPNTGLVDENCEKNPISPYGESKLKCEHLMDNYSKNENFQTCCLRYFNVMGTDPDGNVFEKHDPETHLVPNIIKAYLEKREFLMFGTDYETPDGTCIRDYVDVNDLAELHVLCFQKLLQKQILPQVMNVGIGRGYSVKEVFQVIEAKLGEKIETKIHPRRPGDPPKLVADNKILKEYFPNFPFKTLEESTENLIRLVKLKRLSF